MTTQSDQVALIYLVNAAQTAPTPEDAAELQATADLLASHLAKREQRNRDNQRSRIPFVLNEVTHEAGLRLFCTVAEHTTEMEGRVVKAWDSCDYSERRNQLIAIASIAIAAIVAIDCQEAR